MTGTGWRDYLGAPEGETLAEFRQTGCLVMKTDANSHLTKHMEMSDALLPLRGVERREDHRTVADLPHGPVRARQADGRPGFGEATGGTLGAASTGPRRAT
jgi:sarcosine oxidase subunit beta